MKKFLQTVVTIICIVLTTSLNAQISYSDDFEGGIGLWSGTYSTTAIDPCAGSQSVRDNIWTAAGGELISPLTGVSNAGTVSLSFDYKIIDYTGGGATPATFGSTEVQYGSSSTGPWTTVFTIDGGNHVPSTSCASFSPSFNPGSGDLYLRFFTTYGAGDYYFYVDNVVMSQGAPPSCVGPSALNASNATTTSVDLDWTAGGTETAWNLQYGPAGFTPGTGTIIAVGTNPYTLTGLTSGTAYDFWVQADCGADSSAYAGPSSFTTNATCLDTLTFCYGSGVQTLFMGEVSTPGDYITVTVIAGETESCCDDLIIYEGLGTSGAVLYNAKGDHTGITATSTTGFITVVTNSDGSYDCQDGVGGPYTPLEIAVSCAAPPSCEDPTALNSTNLTTTSVDLGWTAGGTETAWNIQYGPSGFTPGTGTIVAVGTNPYTLTGLMSNTAYDFWVQADCGADSSTYVGPSSFSTPCDAVTVFPFTESFEDSSATRSCWTNIQEAGTADWTYDTGSSGGAIATAYSGAKNARFVSASPSGGGTPATKLVSPELDLSSMSTPRVVFYYGQEEWFGDQNFIRLLYRDNPAGVWTELWSDSTNVASWTEAMVTLPAPSATYQIAFEGINNYGRANVVDEVMVEETPACVAPTALTSDSTTTTSVQLSWTAGGTETVWNIQYGPAGFTPGTGITISGVTANPYLLTGLTAGTAYDFWVQADCGSDTSTYAGPSTFTTLAPPSCYYIINMEDSYGDGWNGANLQVDVAGIVATVELLAGSSGADTVYAYTGDLVTFTFASGTWDTEITYDIIDPLGAIVFTGSYTANTGNDGLAYTDSSSQSVCAPPSCLPPGNLNAERSTSSSADLSWTEVGSATVWNIEYGPLGFAMGTGTTVLGVTSNPYTLTGLNIETAYDYYVQAVCSSSDSSSFAGPHTFQTLCGDTAAPYLNSFNDSVVDCWAQSGADNFDWTLNSGPTVSGTTGPTDDVTGGGNYFYIESSDPVATGDSAILLTLGIDLSTLTTPQLRFFSHMYGASIGTLKVDVTSDEGVTYTNVFSKSGDQGDQWNEEIVNLSAFSGVVMFRITGVVGDDGTGIQYWSDIAIDDFEVREATGIYEQSSSNFSVYPNPSNGSFFVRNNGATNQYTIKVTDVNGKLIYTEAKTMNGYEAVNIDLEVETGVYLLSVSSKDSINTYRLILR